MTRRALAPLLGLLGLASFPAACQTPADPASPAATTGPTAPVKSPAGAAAAPSPDTVVASWEGGQLTRADLDAAAGTQLQQMEMEYLMQRFQTETSAVEQLMIEKLVEAEAASRGLDTEGLIKAEIEAKTPEPTDAEIEEMYAAMARQLRGAPLEQVRDLVAGQVKQRKQGELFQAWISQLKEQKGAKNLVPFPDMPRLDVSIDDDPMLGEPTAPVTIVQFAEYQCPYCGKANATVEQILEDYKGKVRMVYRDFPLSFHDRAIPAAIAANCAGEQGKYWEIHSVMMSNQRALTDSDLEGYARQVGLDLDAWATCRQDPKQRAEVMADFEAGQKLGVTGTPAFFINGIMLSGALPYDMFAQIIDKELEQG